MIELFEQNIRTNARQSSKGNQLKWENDGMWYKADYTGYEGLAEYVVSSLLKKSTLSEDEFATYVLEEMKYKHQVYTGVRSKNFLKPEWQIITLERLFKDFSGHSLYESVWKIHDHQERYAFLVNQVERITGLPNFGAYMNKLLTIDAFFLNEDRHMHNIAVLMNNNGKFAYCPLFDHGGTLLSDTRMEYPLGTPTEILIQEVKAKTFCTSFDEQLDISEALSGYHLHFHFTHKDVEQLIAAVTIYPEEVKQRVLKLVERQMNKYQYLFQAD